MKIPHTFLPEKRLEEKTEQLLEEAKITKEEDTSAKDRLIGTLTSYLDTQSCARPITFYNMLAASLKNEEYTSTESANKRLYYWTKKTDNSEIKILFKRPSNFFQHKKIEFGFAMMKEENLEEFCKRIEKYEKEKNSSSTHYNLVSLTGGLITFGSYCLTLLGVKLYTGINIPGYVCSMGGVCAYCLGGNLYERYRHKKNREKMTGLCSYFTEDEREAIRLALN